MQNRNDLLRMADEVVACEYCRVLLTEEEVEDNGTVCDICKPLDEGIRKADAMGY